MTQLTVGDPAPWFTVASTSSPTFHFNTVAGYRIVLSFLGSSKIQPSQHVLQQFAAMQSRLEALNIPFFGVTIDPEDESLASLVESITYFKLFWDFDQAVSQLYGVCAAQAGDAQYTPTTFVLNQNLQIVKVLPIAPNVETHAAQVLQFVENLPVFEPPAMAQRQAPVLLIPNVFDRALCQQLIELYETDGGKDSGFMRQIDGKTVEVLDHGFKKRRDLLLEEPAVLQRVNTLILQRIKPEIAKVFQFSITRFERHLVACYEDTNQGFFNRHRDNTTNGTVHRRFAMSLNLNDGYDGGCLWFPEYGTQLYRPEPGEAVIFSCSLLHEATPVTSGRRFALLSFFYDDAAAKIREQNQKYVVLQDRQAQTELNEAASSESVARQGRSPTKRGFQPQKLKK